MTHEFGIAVAGLLLIIVALVVLEPCARQAAEHAARAITYDLEAGAAGLLGGDVHLAAYWSASRPNQSHKRPCTGMTVCPARNATSRQVS